VNGKKKVSQANRQSGCEEEEEQEQEEEQEEQEEQEEEQEEQEEEQEQEEQEEQDNGNRSNQESKFDFLATLQLEKIDDEGQQKIKNRPHQPTNRLPANQFSPSPGTTLLSNDL